MPFGENDIVIPCARAVLHMQGAQSFPKFSLFNAREFMCTGTVSHKNYTPKTEAFFGSAQVRTVPVCSQFSPVQVFSLYFDKKKPLHGIFARFFQHFPMFKR